MKKEYGGVHVTARCEDCSWLSKDRGRCFVKAEHHARDFHHKVKTLIQTIEFYNGRKSLEN